MDMDFFLQIGYWVLAIIAALTFFFGTFFTVPHQTAKIIERFGKFSRVAHSGLNIKIPIIEKIRSSWSLEVIQYNFEAETKTKDNVFIKMAASVQFFTPQDRVFDAYYKLSNFKTQMNAIVMDSIRASVPNIKLDEVFEKKEEIAKTVFSDLTEAMDQYGFTITRVLVTDIEPDAKVKAAMNEINSAQRLRAAAAEKGEADKILIVKAAEAEAESKALQGKGIADQRKAIVDGLRASIKEFQDGVPDSTAQDVMSLVLVTQYFDMLKDLGESSETNTILIPHSPSSVGDIAAQLRDSVFLGGKMDSGKKKA